MKKLIQVILIVVVIASCKQEAKTTDYSLQELDVTTSVYPDPISKIFDAHGGIDNWNTYKGLTFEIEKPKANDNYVLDLKSRKSLIEYEHHLLGFDGDNVWLKDLDTVTYKSNPKFYYNLMSYFYAMPFILGDDGINYAEGPLLEVAGKTYPGILISYDTGVGESPEDEYVVYYNPETYKMEWLAYTVTFFSKEKGKKFNLIKYANWVEVDGLQLPTSLQWHHFEDDEVGDMRNEMKFVNATLSKDRPDDQLFEVQKGATIVE